MADKDEKQLSIGQRNLIDAATDNLEQMEKMQKRGEGHAHRDVDGSDQEKMRRQKHHGLGNAGLNADDTPERTEVDGHGGLGRSGSRDT